MSNGNVALEKIFANDIDSKDTVSFNFPKYQKIGTPYDVWLNNVKLVEENLALIINTNPWQSNYPVSYARRDETDDSGNVIHVHFDIFAKSTMITFVETLLKPFVDGYVFNNSLAASGGSSDLLLTSEELNDEKKLESKLAQILLGDNTFGKNYSMKINYNQPADNLANIPEEEWN